MKCDPSEQRASNVFWFSCILLACIACNGEPKPVVSIEPSHPLPTASSVSTAPDASEACVRRRGNVVLGMCDEGEACFHAAWKEADVREAQTRCADRFISPNWRDPTSPRTDAGAGWLPPILIQAIVRSRYRPFQTCYERNLVHSPNLDGRVAMRFVIDLGGNVTNVKEEAETTLRDPDTIACLVAEFGKLVFPAPNGGSVKVVYPIVFTPGE